MHTEEMVRCFSRYHKYTLGTDLRQQAVTIMRTVHRLVFDKAQQKEHLNNLIWQVDDYKLSLQLAMELAVFSQASPGKQRRQTGKVPFSYFETAAQLAAAIGKQCGGWWRSAQNKQCSARSEVSSELYDGRETAAFTGQSPAPATGRVQDRPASLSTRPASKEATP